MSDRLYIKFYVGDYLRDTMHLSAEEHGAYLLLLFDYWVKGEALKDDARTLQKVTRSTHRRWTKIRAKIEPFFQIENGRWYHKRLEKDLGKRTDRSEINSQNATSGWEKRHANRIAEAEQTAMRFASTHNHDQKEEDILSGGASRPSGETTQPTRTVIGENDFESDDGVVLITAEEFAGLDREMPDLKNKRGLVRHACRTWAKTHEPAFRKANILKHLRNRNAENARKVPRAKPTGEEVVAARERREQRARAKEILQRRGGAHDTSGELPASANDGSDEIRGVPMP